MRMSRAEQIKVLKAVRRLLHNPKHWTKHAFARTAGRRSVWPDNPNAVAWCLIGAIKREAKERDYEYRLVLGNVIRGFLPGGYDSACVFNDARTTKHKDVMALLNRGIRSLEGRK